MRVITVTVEVDGWAATITERESRKSALLLDVNGRGPVEAFSMHGFTALPAAIEYAKRELEKQISSATKADQARLAKWNASAKNGGEK
jgi:hypothetical protein